MKESEGETAGERNTHQNNGGAVTMAGEFLASYTGPARYMNNNRYTKTTQWFIDAMLYY